MQRIACVRSLAAVRVAALGVLGVTHWASAATATPSEPVLVSAIGADGLPSGAQIKVVRIEVIDNTVFEPAEIASLIAPYEQRMLGADEIEALRLALTRHFVEAGYVNSGALVPPQSIVNGVLYIRIVEGRLSAIHLSGQYHYRDEHLRRLIWPDAELPLNVIGLQQRMQFLLQDAALQQINARLEPGDAPGESILNTTVKEGPRFNVGLTAADDRPPSVGETGGTVGAVARDLFGVGDSTALSFARTRGYIDYNFNESVPLFVSNVSTFLRADRNHGSIVESSLKDLNIISQESSFEGGISIEVARDLFRTLRTDLSFYYNDTRTDLLGIPFSFTGDDDGHSVVSALRYALDWTDRGTHQVATIHSLVNFGLGEAHLFGATLHRGTDEPDSQFVVWNTQAQYLRQLPTDTEILARASLQLASRNLLPSEQISVGGIDTVRGYATNTLVRDQGGFVSAEVRQTVYRLRIPGVSHTPGDGALALAAFYDLGAGEDKGDAHTWIAGTGVGLRWTPASNCSVVFYKGFELHRLPYRSESLQEQGIHFRVNYDLAF